MITKMLITEISQVSTNHRARVRPCSSVTTRVIQKRNVVIFPGSPCNNVVTVIVEYISSEIPLLGFFTPDIDDIALLREPMPEGCLHRRL